MPHTCTVYFRDAAGKPIGGHVTEASSVFEAARKALKWFADPHWRGPRPVDQTILEVKLVSDPGQVWRVRASQVWPKRPEQETLFEARREALDPQ